MLLLATHTASAKTDYDSQLTDLSAESVGTPTGTCLIAVTTMRDGIFVACPANT